MKLRKEEEAEKRKEDEELLKRNEQRQGFGAEGGVLAATTDPFPFWLACARQQLSSVMADTASG